MSFASRQGGADDGPTGEALARAGDGVNYDRLAALKAKYDPDNLFRMNINIPPAICPVSLVDAFAIERAGLAEPADWTALADTRQYGGPSWQPRGSEGPYVHEWAQPTQRRTQMRNERHERTRKLGSTFANLLMAAGGLGLARKLGAKRTARVVRLVIADRLRQRHHTHGHQAHRSWRSKHA